MIMRMYRTDTEKPFSDFTKGAKKICRATPVKLNTLQALKTELGKDQMPSTGTRTILTRSYSQETSMNEAFPFESGKEGFFFR